MRHYCAENRGLKAVYGREHYRCTYKGVALEQGLVTVEHVELVAKQLTKGSQARKETSSHVNIISSPRSMCYCRGNVNKISRK